MYPAMVVKEQIVLLRFHRLFDSPENHHIKHESLKSNLDLWGPPQTFELLEVVDVIRDQLSNLGYN